MSKNLRLFIVFILFLLLEYVLRSYVGEFKLHFLGFFMDFSPLIFTSIISTFIYKEEISTTNFSLHYPILLFVSISGYLISKALLFFQWYWILHPEYRKINSDFSIGLAWSILESILGSIVIIISYLIIILIQIIYKKIKTSKLL